MKKIFTLTFVFLFTVFMFSQKTISGNVKNEDGKPLPSASVTIEEVGKNAILSFAITNAKGDYKVSYLSNDDKIVVKVKAFNHETILRTYENKSQVLNFTLLEKATEIKEVKLKTKLITKRGDTISYDLKSFESKADRTLADVLKKIPGIEVNKDGSILYQGDPINKFYVNGKDLMEGSYGLINNSLPKDAVQKVEVLENHQPVKILKDKLASENAAINVKLKKSVTMTGRGEISEGIAPYLWNVKLSPMLFTPKVQWVLNYKTNNVGDEVEKENAILAFGNRFEGVRRNFGDNSWISVESASLPQNVPVKRYLMNNVHYLSANLLTNLTKDWEFKANTSYTNNAVDRESKSMVYSNLGGLQTVKTIANQLYTNQAKGEIIFSKNANKSFFKNTLTYNTLWNTYFANTTNNTNEANQKLTSPSNNIQNALSAIIPWKEKLVNVMSFISYRDDRQDLGVTPSSYLTNVDPNLIVITDRVNQALHLKTFEATHSASVGFSKKNWTFTPEVGISYIQNKLITGFNGEKNNNFVDFGTDYQNNIQFKNLKPYAQMMLNYKQEGLDANLVVPVNFNSITATSIDGLSKSLSKTSYEPRLFIRYDLSSFWKISTFAGINYNFGSINDIYNHFILLSTNNMSSKNTDIQETKSNFIGSKLEYRNPLNNLFFSLSYNYNDKTNNIIYLNKLNLVSQQFSIEGYNIENTGRTNGIKTELGKYFPKFKTNASVGYGYSYNANQQLLVNTIPSAHNLVNVKGDSQNASFKLNNNYFSWLSVDYNANWSFSNNQTFVNKTRTFNHALSAYIYPLKNHTLGFTWDEFQSSNGDKSAKNAFYDLSYQYSMVEEKIDLELKVMNITNNNIYENIAFRADTNQTTFTTVNIRPRQVMLSVKFNFK